jgi:hypothetical protein
MILAAISSYLPSSQHVSGFFTGLTFLGIVAHAVNTFPTPGNVYGQWFLGLIKFAVGQRISAMNAFRGNDSVTVPVPQGTGTGVAKSSQVVQQHTDVTPESITVATEKVIKTETVVPNPVGAAHALPPQVPDK